MTRSTKLIPIGIINLLIILIGIYYSYFADDDSMGSRILLEIILPAVFVISNISFGITLFVFSFIKKKHWAITMLYYIALFIPVILLGITVMSM